MSKQAMLRRGRTWELAISGDSRYVPGVMRSYLLLWICLNGALAVDPTTAPLSAEDSLAAIQVDPGYRVELVAAEPLVRDPVSLDWGPDGRLWVVEMADYPYGMDGEGKFGGRIRCLTDTDADGKYDTSTLFLDGLSFPTGVMVWKKGILVTAAPDILYAEDRDGDGLAEHREILFTGFMEGNQQLRVNGLRWGLDNWVHCANGGHHPGFGATNQIRVPATGKAILLGSRDLRFDPGTLNIAPLSGPSQFGRIRDDWGHWFGVQNSYPLWHYVLEDRYLERNTYIPARDARKQLRLPSNPPVYSNKSLQKRFHSFKQSGRFTSACGPAIYRDDALFPQVVGQQHAFTCEPFHNVVQHHLLRDDDMSFVGERATSTSETDFFASSDRWCRPVHSRTGPDGALWVVDMYRYMIEHPDWLPPEGREELKPFYRFGEDYGRIYRIVPSRRPKVGMLRLDSMSSSELVDQLGQANGVVRDLAHRLLVQSQNRTVLPSLEEVAMRHEVPLARLHALSVLQGLSGLTQPLLQRALEDSHPGVRRHALRLLEADDQSSLRQKARAMQDDPDAKVRLQLACTLGGWNDSASGDALAVLARDPDPYLVAAVLSSAMPHFDALVAAIDHPQVAANEAFISGLMTMYPKNTAAADRILKGLLPREGAAPKARHFRLAGHWWTTMQSRGRGQWPTALTDLQQMAVVALGNTQSKRAVRLAALTLVDKTATLLPLLRPQESVEFQQAVILSLAKHHSPDTGKALLNHWPTLSPKVRVSVLNVLLGNPHWTASLLDQLMLGGVSPRDINATHRQRLLAHPDKALKARAERLFEGATDDDAARLAKRRGVLDLKGEGTKGRHHFKQRCAVCHQLGNQGQAIGPDLRAITNVSSEALYNAILAPNMAVDPGYLAYTATLTDDTGVYGMIASESGNSVTFKSLDGTATTVLRTAIGNLQSTGVSFMPEGLDQGLTDQQFADLISFVQQAVGAE